MGVPAGVVNIDRNEAEDRTQQQGYVAETDSAANEKIAKPSGLNLREQYLCSSLMRRTKTDPGFKRYGSMEYSERIAVTWQFEQCFQQTE